MNTISKLYVKPLKRNCYKHLTVFLLDQKALERSIYLKRYPKLKVFNHLDPSLNFILLFNKELYFNYH